jgi:predicted RNA-binding Zn-ribbon protein involved in translation (DUF1610 family)
MNDIEERFAETMMLEDEPLACPKCGNDETFRCFGSEFHATIDGKNVKIDNGDDIHDTLFVTCAKCGAVVSDTLW